MSFSRKDLVDLRNFGYEDDEPVWALRENENENDEDDEDYDCDISFDVERADNSGWDPEFRILNDRANVAELFTLVVVATDGYFHLKPQKSEPVDESLHATTKCMKEIHQKKRQEQQNRQQAERFFRICNVLPQELQMLVCNMTRKQEVCNMTRKQEVIVKTTEVDEALKRTRFFES